MNRRTCAILVLAAAVVAVAYAYDRPHVPAKTAAAPKPDPPAAAPPTIVKSVSAKDKPAPMQAKPDISGEIWIEPDDRDLLYLDFDVEDQDGSLMQLADLVGKPIALSFIFTRCPDPNMCPMIICRMATLQHMAAEAGIGDEVQILLVSYDPYYDTPKQLKNYAQRRGLKFTNARMIRPSTGDLAELLQELDVAVVPNANGTIGHFIELILIDHEGQIASNTRGVMWDNNLVLKQLSQLVTESRDAGTKAD